MSIAGTYEKFKHLDHLLSDTKWLPETIEGYLLHQCWMAIRDAAQPKTTQAHAVGTKCGGVDNDG